VWKLFKCTDSNTDYSDSKVVKEKTTSTDWVTFGQSDGVEAWSKYRVRCTAKDAYGKTSTWDSWNISGSNVKTVQPTNYIYELFADGHPNALNAVASAYDSSGYVKCAVYEGYTAGGTAIYTGAWKSYSGTYSPEITVGSLTANKVYTVRFWINDTNSETYAEIWDRSFICRPALFNWTTAELNAFNNKGKTNVLTTARWDAFTENVAQCAYWWAWNGSVNATSIDNDENIKKIRSAKYGSNPTDKTLTAERFNKVRNGVGGINKLVVDGATDNVPDQVKGNVVYGWFFTKMVNNLNEKSYKRWSSTNKITGGS
jgi:hypothetical protein